VSIEPNKRLSMLSQDHFAFNEVPALTTVIMGRIRFADPARWLGKGMESRLFTISVEGTKQFFSWDAHFPVGEVSHPYYPVNQKGCSA